MNILYYVFVEDPVREKVFVFIILLLILLFLILIILILKEKEEKDITIEVIRKIKKREHKNDVIEHIVEHEIIEQDVPEKILIDQSVIDSKDDVVYELETDMNDDELKAYFEKKGIDYDYCGGLFCVYLDENEEEVLLMNIEDENKTVIVNKDTEDIDLQSLASVIEQEQKPKTINLTPYEEEQEERAIISYEELLKRKEDEDNLIIQDESSSNIVLDDSKETVETIEIVSYEHEENFLQSLKELEETLK